MFYGDRDCSFCTWMKSKHLGDQADLFTLLLCCMLNTFNMLPAAAVASASCLLVEIFVTVFLPAFISPLIRGSKIKFQHLIYYIRSLAVPVVTHHSFVPYRYFREDFVKRSILSICNLLKSDFPNYLSDLFCCRCSVAMSCLTVCNPTDCTAQGSPVLHCLPELAQTHVHWVVMPSSHLILCRPLLLLPPVFPSIRVFSNESALRIRWPKCWSFSFSISPSNEHPGLISLRMDWLDLLAVQGTLKSLLQHHNSKAAILQHS